ncbi:hypothetical protein BDQ12DRAFT_645723 [Crucibulum laeve]|uniref:Uncharacterized protein n=1 Tax=Crucibulum laeve TaxID=68775 RepID=A0A5C3M9V7_9AGAR|nr:hypothetical protein BDQ12DRAFT_645723 [Crucibulum laeve]
MPSASVQAMTRSPTTLQTSAAPSSSSSRPPLTHRTSSSLASREEQASINAILQRTIDETNFIRAQREAFEALNDAALARAIQESERTAAEDAARRRRKESISHSVTSAAAPSELARAIQESERTAAQDAGRRRRESVSATQPVASTSNVPISSVSQPSAAHHSTDEEAARRLARTWNVDALQPALLASTPPSAVSPLASPSRPRLPHASHSVAPSSPSSNSRTPTRPPTTRHESIPITRRPSVSRSAAPVSTSPSTSTSPLGVTSSSSFRARGSSADAGVASSRPNPLPRGTSSSSIPRVDRRASRDQFSSSREQPSYSREQPSQSMPVPLKRASASARDIRNGLSMSPTKNSPPVEPSRKRHRGLSPEHESLESRELFTATRACSRCGNAIVSPRTPVNADEPQASFSPCLHLTCSSCSAVHCRGCFTVVSCSRDCKGGNSCTLKSCCDEVKAIAIFEILGKFDNEYTAQATLLGRDERQVRGEFIKLVMTKGDRVLSHRFAWTLDKTLKPLVAWLEAAQASGGRIHPTIQRLFSVSYLLEVIHFFLANDSRWDWVFMHELLTSILNLLRVMVDCGLGPLLAEPLRNIEQSCGLHCWIWDRGFVTWESEDIAGEEKPVRSPPVYDLLKGQRRELTGFVREIKDGLAVEKANELSDGISYLLLQQMVGGV